MVRFIAWLEQCKPIAWCGVEGLEKGYMMIFGSGKICVRLYQNKYSAI
jgi:hypothetical protein